MIDELNYIKTFNNPLCSSNKEYHIVLRLLKATIKLIEKPIVLLSQLDYKVAKDDVFNYYHYLRREKYCDYVLVLHYPYLAELSEDKTKSSLIIAKSKKIVSKLEFDLCYSDDYCLFT